MNIDTNNYEIIDFQARLSNTSTKIRGFKVGQYLIVSYADIVRAKNWRIYRFDGRPFLETTFVTSEDAIAVAEWLSKAYEDYFFILKDYPDSELWHLTYLTIENGTLYRDVIEKIKEMKAITWLDVQQYLH